LANIEINHNVSSSSTQLMLSLLILTGCSAVTVFDTPSPSFTDLHNPFQTANLVSLSKNNNNSYVNNNYPSICIIWDLEEPELKACMKATSGKYFVPRKTK
jgi:hypothetical protein